MLGTAYKICPHCSAHADTEHKFCPVCGASLEGVEVAREDPYIGRVVAGKYSVDELIGQGAMGRVYRGQQTTLNKPFAIKILAPHLINDETSRARFANEAQNAASLNHPNCVSVVDYGSEEGITYIVMEFIRGVSLERIITEQAPLPRARVVDLILQLLAALDEAHGLGILHRDLKPDNILVQQLRTHGELIKILDFGIAKLMDDAPGATPKKGLTNQGIVCGTPEYMSPEQARGQHLDARSDLYAVGVILYQMLAARLPFEAESAVDVLHMHLHEEPVPPSRVLGTAPDPLESVCMRALSKDADGRFESAADFREAIVGAASPGAQPAGDFAACTNCGARVEVNARFCPSCGTPQRKQAVYPQRRRPPTRSSGLHPQIDRGQETTAEILVRRFPLPLAGREPVMQELRALVAARNPGVDMQILCGPRGIGKTRLADEIAARAQGEGWRVFYVGNDPSGARTPLWPVQQMVAQLMDLDPDHVTTQALGRAANLVGVAFEELPGLAQLYLLDGPAHNMEYQVRRRECYASAVQGLLAGGRGDPLLLVFDDIDLYDTPTRDILRRLAHADTEQPIVVVVTTTEPDVTWLGGHSLQLAPLSAEEVQGVCTEVARGTKPESNVPERLGQTAPLTPLRLELQLRLWAFGLDFHPNATDADLIRARMDALDGHARMVLEHAAILGERIPEEELVELLSSDDSGPMDGELGQALTDLQVAGLLLATRPGERAFSHRQVYEVVHDAIDEERLRALHLRAAEVVKGARNSVPVRGVHLLASGSQDAVTTLEAAADEAIRRFDDRSARDYLRAALSANSGLPNTAERRAFGIRLAKKASETMWGQDTSPQTVDMVKSQLVGDLEPQDESTLRCALGRQYLRMGKTEEAVAAFRDGLAAAIGAGERSMMLEVYTQLGKLYARQGDFKRALQELQEGLDMSTLGEGARSETDLNLWRYLLRISEIQRSAGDLRLARQWCEHALFQAERTEDDLGRLRCHAQMAWLLRELNQLALADQHVARALDHARYFGDRLTTAELLLERARARAARGKLEEARRVCEDALRLARVLDWKGGVLHAQRAIAMLDGQASEGTSSDEYR